MMKDYENAIYNFEQAIRLKPKDIEFFKNRAQCFYDMGYFENSIDDLNLALEIKSNCPQILYKLGLTYFAFKKYKKCIKTMKRALEHNPFMTYEADIYYHLGLAYCRLQKFEKSIFPYRQCIMKIPSDLRYIHERAKAY